MSIESEVANVDLVKRVFDQALEGLELDSEVETWLELAVREAVANAIVHGNGEDPDKRVEVSLKAEDDELVIQVADEGQGFDPDLLPDPRDPENLLRPNGRGIFYMRQCMDSIDYDFQPAGTVVTMRKKMAAAAASSEVEEKSE